MMARKIIIGQENSPSAGDWVWRRSWDIATLPPRTICPPPWYWGIPGRLLAMAAPWLSAESMPGGVPVQPLP